MLLDEARGDVEASMRERMQHWLSRHCERSGAVDEVRLVEGLVAWRGPSGIEPVALWPGFSEGEGVGEALLALASEVAEVASGMVSQLDEAHLGIGYPVSMDGEVAGAVALSLAIPPGLRDTSDDGVARARQSLVPLMQRLEEGVAALERDLMSERQEDMLRHQAVLGDRLSLLAGVLSEATFAAASAQLVTRLAEQFGAERVSLGWRRGASCRVLQISHSAQFNRKMNRVKATAAAMDEALDQLASVACPPVEGAAGRHDGGVQLAHQELVALGGVPSVVSVPCLDDGVARGAVTLERDRPFTLDEIEALESLLALCTRALEEKRRNDRPLAVKALASAGEQLERLLGPGHLGLKLAVLALVALLVASTLITTVDEVAAEVTVESRVQRVLSAPFRGYLEATSVRAGDRVERGQVLASMETRELLLERLQWQSEIAKLSRQEQESRARGDRAGLNVLAAQREQAEARVALVESRLNRATLVAPFDGVVVSGDLTQRLGAVTEQGEELFRVSPLDGFRLDLAVPEGRIDDLAPTQHGSMVLASMTGKRWPLVVERITPRSTSGEGQTRFIVEARLEMNAGEVDPRQVERLLRPGLSGIARVEVGEGPLIEIWTRGLRDWLKLTLWRWWG